jgi:hypothetical protein
MKAIPVLKEPVEEDDDADYKPIPSKYINTRCDYDEAKIDRME